VGVPLRVLCYNVHNQKDDVAALASVVRGLAPDVVVVQEGPRRFRWRHKTAALADRLGMVVAAGGLPSLGNVLLTTLRVRVGDTWCLRYPLTPGRHLRGAAFASCAVTSPAGETARFVVTGSHLATDPVERPAQATRWRAAIDEVDLPVIAAADLNEEPGGAAWTTASRGLVDPAEKVGRGDRLTFPCPGANRRIDGVFVDPRIDVVDYDVVDTPESRRASDHFPVLVDLSLPIEEA
jgi:endonuclease/exonuclease/phosphatase family metal-dependent hydrolase